jgi:hypothetical protein
MAFKRYLGRERPPVKDGGGQATFKTVQGEPLTITEKGRLSTSLIRKAAPPASRSPTFCNRTA